MSVHVGRSATGWPILVMLSFLCVVAPASANWHGTVVLHEEYRGDGVSGSGTMTYRTPAEGPSTVTLTGASKVLSESTGCGTLTNTFSVATDSDQAGPIEVDTENGTGALVSFPLSGAQRHERLEFCEEPQNHIIVIEGENGESVGYPYFLAAEVYDGSGVLRGTIPCPEGCSNALGSSANTGTYAFALTTLADRDGDGFPDSSDSCPDEFASPDSIDGCPTAAPQCEDEIDNDLDGHVDYPDDLECLTSKSKSEGQPPACADGEDNDQDGFTDHPADPDCSSSIDDSEQTPKQCENGLDDDGDGSSDYPADPGCASTSDGSERGTTACDNGVDDDGDGRADYPADGDCQNPAGKTEQVNCRTSGQTMRAALNFKGKVAFKFFPDAHLFDFQPSLIYCFGGGAAEVISASTLGTVDYGTDTAVFENLGFTFAYDPSEEQVTKGGSSASFSGDFEIHFDYLSLLGRFGVTGLVKKKLGKKFTSIIAKKLQRYAYSHQVKSDILKAAYEIRKRGLARYNEWADKAVDKAPGVIRPLMKWMTNRLEKKVAASLKQYEENIASVVSTDRLAHRTAAEITAIMTNSALQIFKAASDKFNTFSVWTPVINAQVLSDGRLSVFDEGFHNFNLSFEYSEDKSLLP